MATRIIAKTDLRERIRHELSVLGSDTLLITDRGRPVAVALSVERWNDLQESLEDLEDTVAVLEHRLSGRKGRPAEQVLTEIEAERPTVARSSRQTS